MAKGIQNADLVPSKTEEFERPFITKITIAKQRIDHLFSDIFSTPLWEKVESNLDVEKEDETEDENRIKTGKY